MKPPRARGAVLRGVVCGQRDALFAPRNMRVQPAQQPYLAGRLLDGSWKAPRRFPGRARGRGRAGLANSHTDAPHLLLLLLSLPLPLYHSRIGQVAHRCSTARKAAPRARARRRSRPPGQRQPMCRRGVAEVSLWLISHRQRLPPRGDRGGGEERSREAEQLEGVALRRRHAARLCGDRVQVRPARAPAGSDERR